LCGWHNKTFSCKSTDITSRAKKKKISHVGRHVNINDIFLHKKAFTYGRAIESSGAIAAKLLAVSVLFFLNSKRGQFHIESRTASISRATSHAIVFIITRDITRNPT